MDETARIIAALDTAGPEALLGYFQTTLALRGRIGEPLFWRLVKTISTKLMLRLLAGFPEAT